MAIIPDNTTDTGIHKLVERNEYPRTSEMDRMAAELFGRDLDLAKHTAAAADQINAAMRKPVIDLRDMGEIRYEFKGTFRGVQTWWCWDEKEGQEILGEGESKKMALVDFLDKRGVEPRPRLPSRVIHHSNATDPTDYSDRREPDFDDDLESGDGR